MTHARDVAEARARLASTSNGDLAEGLRSYNDGHANLPRAMRIALLDEIADRLSSWSVQPSGDPERDAELTHTFVDLQNGKPRGPERYMPLPRGAEVVFWPHLGWPDNGRRDCLSALWVPEQHATGRAHLRIMGSGGRNRLQLTPVATNVIEVREEGR